MVWYSINESYCAVTLVTGLIDIHILLIQQIVEEVSVKKAGSLGFLPVLTDIVVRDVPLAVLV